MTESRRLRIIKQVLSEIQSTNKPIGWRKIKRRFGLKDSVAKSIAQTVLDITRLNIKPTINIHIETPELKFERKNNLNVFILLSDWHIGEIVNNIEINEYDLEIAYTRILKYLNEVGNTLKLLQPKNIYILALGDLCSGVIHDELEDQTDVITQVSATVYFLSLFIKTIKPTKVFGCFGNHGVFGNKKKNKNMKNNFDLLIYNITSLITNTEIETSKNPYLIVDTSIGPIFLAHGNHIMSYAGIPIYGVLRKQLFVHNLCRMKGIDIPKATFLAHFHEPQNITSQGENIFINGTLMGTNEYAFKKGLICEPSQKMVVIGVDIIGEYNYNLNTVEKTTLPERALEITKWT